MVRTGGRDYRVARLAQDGLMATRGQRRGRGEGSLLQLAPKVWRLRVFVGTDPVTGKPKQASRTFHGGKTDALRELRRLVDDRAVKQSSRNINMLFDAWLEHLSNSDRAPSTVDTYRIVIEKHLRPAFGQKRMRTLGSYDLDRYYAAQRQAGMAPATVQQHHAILSAALNQATRWGWLAENPAKLAERPKKPRELKMIPAVGEVRALIDACGEDLNLAVVISVAAITGCRRGELCGLQWQDVDWQTGTLAVVRQRVPLKGGDRTVPLKSGDVHGRTVALGELGLEVLARWRAEIDERARRMGATVGPESWLLVPEDCGKTPWRAKQLGEAITALGRRAGVPVTTHAFRRFAATQLVGSGADIRTIAGRMGHTPDILLRVYAGFLPERDRQAANVLEATVLGGTKKEVT